MTTTSTNTLRRKWSDQFETIETTPAEAATSRQGLTNRTPSTAKTTGETMAVTKDRPALLHDDPRHGTWAGYGAGCRLECCRVAARQYQKLRVHDANHGKRRLIDATATKRRLQALAAIGWDFYSIATEAGQHREWVWQIYRRDTVLVRTDERIAEVYERICMTRPEGWVADRARRSAAAKGWVPPLGWNDIATDPAPPTDEHDDDIDEVKVDRVVNGIPQDCTKAERLEVIRRWEGSLRQLEEFTGWNVHRDINESEAAA